MSSLDTAQGIPARVTALRARWAKRDVRHAEVQAVRRGDFEAIAPDLFSDEWRRPIVANMIDTSARDMAAVLAPLPSFNCSAASGLSEVAKKFADRRTKIARNYIETSDFAAQMARGADQYNTYGLLVLAVEPDFDENLPRLSVEDSIGAYPVWNKKGETVELARVFRRDWFSLVADYPAMDGERRKYPAAVGSDNRVEVIKYVSKDRVMMYLPHMGDRILEDIPNPLGKCYYVAVQRPGLDEEIRGAYDDVIFVQLARHRIQMLLMEGVEKSVRAPIVVPPDINELPLGPDSVLQTQQGVNSVGRLRLDVPAQAFGAVEQLKQEQMVGSMAPEARSGNVDASVITGRGVQQLMAGFNTQISVAQTAFKYAFKHAIGLAFQLDEKVFGGISKTVRGNEAGVPYSFSYLPSKDIKGDYTVDVSYGFSAGLDPNRATVLLLQIDGARLASRDYVRRNLPVDLNAVEEERKIMIEDSRNSIIQGMSALAQSIPQMAAAGGDPSTIIHAQATFISLLTKGKSVEEAAQTAFAPPEPPPGASTPGVPPGPGSEPAPGGAQEQGGSPAGFGSGGMPQGLIPGQATMGQGGRPPLEMLMSGMTQGGAPNMQANISRRNPAR